MLNHEIKWDFLVLISYCYFIMHPLHTKYTVETYGRGFGSIPEQTFKTLEEKRGQDFWIPIEIQRPNSILQSRMKAGFH